MRWLAHQGAAPTSMVPARTARRPCAARSRVRRNPTRARGSRFRTLSG